MYKDIMEHSAPAEIDLRAALRLVGIVTNTCHGGFGISEWALDQFKDRARRATDGYIPKLERTDELLIELIKTHGSKVNGPFSSLIIQYMPHDYYINNCYRIDEYDGVETLILLHEKYKLKKITEIIENEKSSAIDRIENIKQLLNRFEEEMVD